MTQETDMTPEMDLADQIAAEEMPADALATEAATGLDGIDYQLAVPDAVQQQLQEAGLEMQIDADSPLAKSALAWAQQQQLPAEAFNGLVENFLQQQLSQYQAAEQAFQQEERALTEMLGENADAQRQHLGKWVSGLVGDKAQEQPALQHALNDMTSTAGGVLLLKMIKQRLGETQVPSARDHHNAGLLDYAELRKMQASDAYLDSNHPEHKTVRRQVEQAWMKRS